MFQIESFEITNDKMNRRGTIFRLSVRPSTNVHYLRTSWKNDLTRSDQSLALPNWLFLIFEYSKFFGECLEWLIVILAWWCYGCPPLILHQFPASERSVNVRAFMPQIWKKKSHSTYGLINWVCRLRWFLVYRHPLIEKNTLLINFWINTMPQRTVSVSNQELENQCRWCGGCTLRMHCVEFCLVTWDSWMLTIATCHTQGLVCQ